MTSLLRYAGLGLLAYLIFLAATLPAAHAYPLLKERLAPLQLYGVQGTLWSGRASDADLKAYRLGRLNWQLNPWALLLGRLEIAWTARKENGTAQGRIARTLTGKVRISDLTADIPVSELGGLANLGQVRPDGVLRVKLSEVTMDGHLLVAAHGTLAWENARVLTSQAVALGNFILNIDTGAAGITGTLLDKGGPLKAQGVLTVKHEGSYQFSGAFTPQPGTAQVPVTQALGWLGAPGPDGKISVSWSGTLPGVNAAPAKSPLPNAPITQVQLPKNALLRAALADGNG